MAFLFSIFDFSTLKSGVRSFATMIRNELARKRQRHYDAGATLNRQLRCLQIGRSSLAATSVSFDVKGDLLTLNQTTHAGALEGGDMHEHIRPLSCAMKP